MRQEHSKNMSAVPQGAFAAVKVRQVLENSSRSDFQEKEKTEQFFLSNHESGLEQPPKYSSKLMNSIWGLYNQYSVHNLKKNKDSADFAVFGNQCM